ncbi:MAG: glycoside hydrolase family 27 protein, partial [Acidimicrobiales bacterium]|nr:glycoside hydrolase family 27 protein [Acidimicrobiales bacterium]
NIDDHWHAPERNPDGTPAADPRAFPDGIGALADQLHAAGLKLGIYSDAAEKTCGNCFGGLAHERIDAETYAAWGVDYLKYDYCHAPRDAATAIERYGTMGDALARSGRSIVYSACEWGGRRPWTWAPEAGAALWRTTWDIFDTFGAGRLGVKGIARRNLGLGRHAGPGHWNDPDMLLVGNHGRGRATGTLRAPFSGNWRPKLWSFRGLTDVEAHTHVTLWAMMAAPLLASHDLSESDPYDLALLTNPEVVAIDQDPLGHQARVVEQSRHGWILEKRLAGGGVAVSLTNMGRRPRTLSITGERLGLRGDEEVFDAWTHEVQRSHPRITAHLPAHGSALLVIH